jgi:hypothetical protein
MMNGRNNGKKLMAVRIVAHAFEIVRFESAYTRCASSKPNTFETRNYCEDLLTSPRSTS